MKTPETTIVFAGVDGTTTAQLPSWYNKQQSVSEVVSFSEAVRQLPRAIETTVAYENPYTGAWVSTDRFTALVDPERAQDVDSDGERVDPLFYKRMCLKNRISTEPPHRK